ncbi:MAG: Gfo/Idh/MocA family oxidoreductase [Chloroflexi bacterium]|nr:Gfo/Idh/MocA family oxidoreductase [Chloroflexota bacterium]
MTNHPSQPDAIAEAAPQVNRQAKPLRVGVIGLGKVGKRRANICLSHPDLDLVSVCDVDQELAALYPNADFYTEYADLINTDLDVVIVAAYNNIAPDATVESLNTGKHVFCEKPPGRTVEDVERIIAAEQANPGLKLQFGFNHRHHYAVMEVKEMIDSGRFGNILWIRGVYGKSGGESFENIWRNDVDIAGGGILLDQGIHMLDLFRYYCGDFVETKSFVTTAYWNIPVEDNAFAMLRTAKNQVATIHSSATQWRHRFVLEIGLELGYININGILSSTRSYGEEHIVYARRQFESEASAFGKPREQMVFFDRDDSWTLEMNQFVQAIRNDEQIDNGNSHDALKAMQLVWDIYQSGRIE